MAAGEKEHLRLVVAGDESIHEQLFRNALDGIPTPMDWVYQQLDLPEPAAAWDLVRRAVGTSSSEPPLFAVAEINAAVDVVGWREIGWSQDQEGVRNHFLRSYITLVARRARDARNDGLFALFRPVSRVEGKRTA